MPAVVEEFFKLDDDVDEAEDRNEAENVEARSFSPPLLLDPSSPSLVFSHPPSVPSPPIGTSKAAGLIFLVL